MIFKSGNGLTVTPMLKFFAKLFYKKARGVRGRPRTKIYITIGQGKTPMSKFFCQAFFTKKACGVRGKPRA